MLANHPTWKREQKTECRKNTEIEVLVAKTRLDATTVADGVRDQLEEADVHPIVGDLNSAFANRFGGQVHHQGH